MKYILLLILITVSCTGSEPEIPRVPEWTKDAVWYQIFPERFNNGDNSNDPGVDDVINIWPYIEPADWQVHPWTSDWYKLQPWEEELDYDFYQLQGLRRYGGDLQGVLDKLDYLQELGINAIYFNPIFESPSLHKYDASMYHHIDNNFGPDPELDSEQWNNEDPGDASTWKWTSADSLFLVVIEEAHKRNIKIIIDGVFNHVGTKFWAFRDVLEKQENSRYKEWFTINSWDDKNTEQNEFDYDGWNGIKDLPEIKEDNNGPGDEFQSHVHDVVKRWMDPNNDGDPSDGIDGWRLDVAEKMSLNFWITFRSWVKKINPDAYLVGEVWWEDWPNNKMFNASPWLQGNAFDAVMNYRFARAVKNYVIDDNNQITSLSFADTLKNIYTDYHSDNMMALMNMLDSHDVDRIASQIKNPDTRYDHEVNAAQNENYNVEAPDAIGVSKLKLIIALQMTLPGAPAIYYGTEAGMWGGDDPDCRKPMVWPEFDYEIETAHPFNNNRKPDSVKFNYDVFNWYKKLINIRKSNRLLSTGKIEFYPLTDEVLVYKRYEKNNKIFILINNQNLKIKFRFKQLIEFNEDHEYNELISDKQIDLTDGYFLEPYSIGIFSSH